VPTRQEITDARKDLGAFGRLMGHPLTDWQLEALSLRTRQTCLVSPRQCGKSYSLSVLACWWAFRRPRQVVLVVSATQDAAERLLESVRLVASHPLLAGSVDEELKTRVVLSNGSRVLSVPASPKQVRGWSTDLLIVDEAAFVDDDLLASAAIPTTMARPDARIVLASTPWGDAGVFYDWAMKGLEPGNPVTRSYRWKLSDAHWITEEVIEGLRQTLSPLRFAAEIEGEWVGSGDAFFPRDDILAAVLGYQLIRDGHGTAASMGLDWGRLQDCHAIAIAALLDDYGANGRPVIIVPWVETSRRRYPQQVAEIESLAAHWQLSVFSETNGAGLSPTDDLRVSPAMGRHKVTGVHTSQRTKEDCYGRVADLLASRSLVLPDHMELLRQMAGISAKATQLGGLTIEARQESVHDDLPDALSLAVGGLPRQLADVPVRDVPEGTEWQETPGGVKVPFPLGLLAPEASWLGLNGPITRCPSCHLAYPAYKDTCQFCGAASPAPAVVHVITDLPAKDAPAASAGNPWNPDLMRCPRGHLFDGRHFAQCPSCHGGGPGRPGSSGSALPGALAGLLGRR
jgi:hypothetical protein